MRGDHNGPRPHWPLGAPIFVVLHGIEQEGGYGAQLVIEIGLRYVCVVNIFIIYPFSPCSLIKVMGIYKKIQIRD